MKLDKKFIITISRDIFIVLFILFIVFSFMELLKPRIVLNYINLDLYLFALIILGAMVISYSPLEKKEITINNKLNLFLIGLSIVIGILVTFLVWTIGLISILIGIISAIINYLMINLILKGR